MRIFLSYDDTCRDVAQRIAVGLRAGGHGIFFDQDSLPAGTSYDERIRRAIRRSHLFVFLINRESIRSGAYALTELAIAEQRWAHPDGRVLPVRLDDTPIASLPPYLRAVSVLLPQGDVVADTLGAVATLVAERRRRLARRALVSAAVLAALAALLPLAGLPRREPGAEDDASNPRTWTLKNDRHVRLVGALVSNGSNVADGIVRKEIEWNAWRYNRCYDAAFGHLSGSLPEGTVVIAFEIEDQLPRAVRVERSDFDDAAFSDCVVGTVIGQTFNAAGARGAGPVSYSFRFVPN